MRQVPIQIRNAVVAGEIRELAQLTGQSITAVVADAVRTRLEKERARAEARKAARGVSVAKTLARLRALPVIGPGLTDADLYDDQGLPR